MKNLTNKQKKILIGVFIVLFIVGLGGGIFLGISSKNNENYNLYAFTPGSINTMMK